MIRSSPHIPRCMSTQHPDNARIPPFAEGPELGGEAEVQEAYYVFSQLGCDEQMWDHEGKEVDNFVVSKLLGTYGSYFRQHRLGQDVFLTLRVPNPSRERGLLSPESCSCNIKRAILLRLQISPSPLRCSVIRGAPYVEPLSE